MPPRFRTRTAEPEVPATPELLYDDLPKPQGAPGALWGHQTDVLRAYQDKHLRTRDVALELPTGAGKTLPGLLIAEWRRRKYAHRVLYACPTQQLAEQTWRAAAAVGLDVVTLVGRHRTWSTADKIRYESGRAVAVVTYSTVFNARPALEAAQTLLFDDAHAAEQYVAGAWSIDVPRHSEPGLYARLLAHLRPVLSGTLEQALAESDPDAFHGVHLLAPADVRRVAESLRTELRALGPDHDLYWRAAAVSDRIDRCLVFATWGALLIRPVLPPTHNHTHFTAAEQRLYLSATLGDGGELERSFGRHPISRLPLPEGWDGRSAGRRFFVFPELQTAVLAREVAAAVVREAGKALVLAPSRALAALATDLLPEQGAPLIGPDGKVEDLLAQFRPADRAVLALAARYDGLDLPGTQCRVTVLDGLPQGAHLQERFLSETLLAGRVLRERQRTRVVQGAGRCTRGLSDHSVVVVLGEKATRFLSLPEVHDALRAEIQAEVDFGLENSDVPLDDLLAFVRSFLAQDQAWLHEAEPDVRERRRTARRTPPADSGALADAARHEVRALAALWSGDWAGASEAAVDAADSVRAANGLSGYRAFWLFLAAGWLGEHARDNDQALAPSARRLLAKAYAAGKNTGWLRQSAPLYQDQLVLSDEDRAMSVSAAACEARRLSGARWASWHNEMLNGLAGADSDAYEHGLIRLGLLLGADSTKPPGPGRTDAAWVWPSWWVAVEAKSEEQAAARCRRRRSARPTTSSRPWPTTGTNPSPTTAWSSSSRRANSSTRPPR